MPKLRATVLILIFFLGMNMTAFAGPIKVCINVRGTTGLEKRVENILGREFRASGDVSVIAEREDCHLYLDLALVEQEPIHFYALGISIAYHMKDKLYSAAYG